LTVDPEELADVETVVRRTLAARVSDPHLIDEIAQETLLRMTRRGTTLPLDEQRAYAVVIARNLLATHFRRRSVHDRHAHRLTELSHHAVDPEQRTLDNEERVALSTAMDRVDPGERDLLVRHELNGTDLATLADEAGVSRGAIAMRLARARANLRLEYLLVFRRVRLPTGECRPALLALAAGDQRRQAQLGAADHVEHCPVCASLLPAMTERNRRVAGWLLIPAAGLRRLWRSIREHWVTAVSAAIVAVTGVSLLIVVVGRDDDADRLQQLPTAAVVTTSGAPPTASSAPPTTQPTTTAPTSAIAPASAPPDTAAPAETLPPPPTGPSAPAAEPAPRDEPGCPAPQPLAALDVSASIGCPFAVSAVTVLAASGSHVSASAGGRAVSIDVVGAQLPVTVVPGVTLRVSGVVLGGSAGQANVSVQAGDLQLGG
jgi:RNA polymerase sigma factor (sigma-70 family)